MQVELLVAGGRKRCLVVVKEETDPRHCHTVEGVEVHHQAFLLPLAVVDLEQEVHAIARSRDLLPYFFLQSHSHRLRLTDLSGRTHVRTGTCRSTSHTVRATSHSRSHPGSYSVASRLKPLRSSLSGTAIGTRGF